MQFKERMLTTSSEHVIKHVTSIDRVLAIKVKPAQGLDRTEADVIDYATSNHILAPKVF